MHDGGLSWLAILATQAKEVLEGRDWLKHAISTIIASIVAASSATYAMSIRNNEQIASLTKSQDLLTLSVDRRFDKFEVKLDTLRDDVYELRSKRESSK